MQGLEYSNDMTASEGTDSSQGEGLLYEKHPDAILLKAIRNGDEKAFSEFYDHFSPMAYGLLCKILNDAKEAEDVLQEGFLQIWNKAASYDPARSSPSTWAIMIFRHKAIDHLRMRQRESWRMERLGVEIGDSDHMESPMEEIGLHEKGKQIALALREIPDDQGQAIRLAFFTGLSQTEIAEKLRTPLGTIKARIRRGLLKLSEILGGKL